MHVTDTTSCTDTVRSTPPLTRCLPSGWKDMEVTSPCRSRERKDEESVGEEKWGRGNERERKNGGWGERERE